MKQISKSKFKMRALAYFREVEETSEPLIITDYGRPTIKISAIENVTPEERFDSLKGSVLRFQDPLEPVSSDEWEALK